MTRHYKAEMKRRKGGTEEGIKLRRKKGKGKEEKKMGKEEKGKGEKREGKMVGERI